MATRSSLPTRSVADAGWALHGPLPPLGRASRHTVQRGGVEAELLELPREDLALAERLRRSGEEGVFGIVDGGQDGGRVWLVRALPPRALAEVLRARRDPWPARDAVHLGISLARALACCERQALSPGPVAPETLRVDETNAVVLPAEDLLAARLGAPLPTRAPVRQGTVAPLWTPPAQLDGAPWDAAANRWALGLILYRALSGEHPFGGGGLRHALSEAAHREAPPFADAIAGQLPAGLQSLVLRLLDPDPERRERSASAALERLLALGRGERPETDARRGRGRTAASPAGPTRRRAREVPTANAGALDEPAPREGTSEPPPRRNARQLPEVRAASLRSRRLAALIPIGLGALVGALGLALSAQGPDAAAPSPSARARPVTATASVLRSQETTALDCASCHPRAAAEWRRSVMAHSVKSPLFNALESLVEEQIGRDLDCPNGAGALRRTSSAVACRNAATGLPVSGSGGEHWCVNCHAPAEAQGEARMPLWEGRAGGDPRSRHPVRDLLGERGIEGISCGYCHQVHGPVGRRGSGEYEGNPTWTSFVTGLTYSGRPEDGRGLFGIANSGARVEPHTLLGTGPIVADPNDPSPPRVHQRPAPSTKAYLASSEFCGSCHDVRLFGTDAIGNQKGEHFKRLRNAYTEWDAWARAEQRAGRPASTCQDCHMSLFPGVCEPVGSAAAAEPGAGGGDDACPPGTRFSSRPPGSRAEALPATSSTSVKRVAQHWFSGVDLPLSREYPDDLLREAALDAFGVPLSPRARRDQLLRATFRFQLTAPRRSGGRLEIPLELTNVGAGHRVPAGFSQEREVWVHLRVTGQGGRVVYEVGRIDRPDQDLRDKQFVRVSTDPDRLDPQGRPIGLFGADLRDGPDVPRWSPNPALGGSVFRGEGLINFQNGFLRCVRCIGVIDASGECQPGPGQGLFRADRFDDGDYDLDTGECRSNLSGHAALFETYFPVGALDASRGVAKAPDAIVDTRSAPPNVPLRYTYDVATRGVPGPYRIEARLMFRAFPPFLVRAFADYERFQASRGRRPSGPLVDDGMLARLEVTEMARAESTVP